MREVLNSEECEELSDLWRRRTRLSAVEVGRIHRLVRKALLGYSSPEVDALGEVPEELIAQFILSKILRLDSPAEASNLVVREADDGHGEPTSSHALGAHFRRYLIDCTRASSLRREVILADQACGSQDEEHLPRDESIEDYLALHGLSLAKVSRSAKTFIATLPRPERILLCEHFGRGAAIGLAGVASRHMIASYHCRAGRLGLVHKGQGLPSDFAKTLIGDWVQQALGIPIEPENMSTILAVFKILGIAAAAYSGERDR
jgi:hypothetical protein